MRAHNELPSSRVYCNKGSTGLPLKVQLTKTAFNASQGRPADAKDNGRQVDISDKLSLEDRQLVVRRALNTEQQDAQDYLERVRARFDRWAFITHLAGSFTLQAVYLQIVWSDYVRCRFFAPYRHVR